MGRGSAGARGAGLEGAGAAGRRACKTAVHICYGYGIKANTDWKQTLGQEWRQYEQVFPALAKSSIDQVSPGVHSFARAARADGAAEGKDVMVGVIDVACEQIETPEEVADTIGRALQFVAARAPHRLHQLRPGADEPRRRRGQAGGAVPRRGPRIGTPGRPVKRR